MYVCTERKRIGYDRPEQAAALSRTYHCLHQEEMAVIKWFMLKKNTARDQPDGYKVYF